MPPASPITRTLPSQTELLQFVDRLALARASELARASRFSDAIRVLLEDSSLLSRSPEACDLHARIWFRLGCCDAAHVWWKRAGRLSGGAEPYRSLLAYFEDYARWRKRRRRTIVRALAWRKTRRLFNGIALFLKRKITGLLCRKKTQPIASLPPPSPTAAPTVARESECPPSST